MPHEIKNNILVDCNECIVYIEKKIREKKPFKIKKFRDTVEQSRKDILEFIITGAKAVALGTMLFVYQKTIQEILNDLKNLLKKMNISDINHIVGTLTLNRS